MARRNDHTKEELRKMTIAAGREIISEVGFSNFSTRQSAKKIGYTVGTLYNIFDGYDDIVLNINATILDDMKKFLENNANPKLKNAAAVKNLAKLYIEFAQKNNNCWSSLFEYNVPEELELPGWYQERIQGLFEVVEKILSEFIDQKSEALQHAKVIWASIHGICVLNLTKKLNVAGAASAEVLTDSLIENYLRGLQK